MSGNLKTDQENQDIAKASHEHLERFQLAYDSAEENAVLTPAERRKLSWKLDLRILSLVSLLYFLNILDRISLSGATAYGLRRDLGLVGNDYNIGISIFYIFYCLAEIPSNILLKRFSGKVWLPLLAIGYGLTSLGSTFIKTRGQFFAVRVLLGITEAGTPPGCTYYLSLWYERDQLSFRLPIMMAATIFANAIGALLSTAYVSVGRIAPSIYGWRNIFFGNALITLGVAVIAYFLLPESPATAKMLTERERSFIMLRSKRETAGLTKEEVTRGVLIRKAFRQPIVYIAATVWFVAQILAASLQYFLVILYSTEFGYTGNSANVHTAAVWFVNIGIMLFVGYLADRTSLHAPYIAVCFVVSIIGACVLFYAKNANIRYGGSFFAAVALTAAPGVASAWAASNLAPYSTRAVGIGAVISFGSTGGVLGAWVFLPSEARRGYPTGVRIILAFEILVILTTLGGWYYLAWENKQRALGKRDHRFADKNNEELDLLGSEHPGFRLAY